MANQDFSFNDTTYDFSLIEEQLTNFKPNLASARNIASQAATLQGNDDEVMATQQKISTDLETFGESPTLNSITQGVRQRALEANIEAMSGILLDPNLTPEIKRTAAEQVMAEEGPMDALGSEVIISSAADPNIHETEETADFRIDGAAMINQFWNDEVEKQHLFNKYAYKNNRGALGAALEFAKALIPLAQNIQLGRVVDDINKELGEGQQVSTSNIMAMGFVKEDLRESLNTLPTERRKEVTEKLYAVIDQHKNVLFTEQNLNTIGLMNEIQAQGYDDFDKWFDTIFSWVEIAGLGGARVATFAGKGLVKGIRRSKQLKNMRRLVTRGDIEPQSVYAQVKQANPEAARKLHATAVISDDVREAVVNRDLDTLILSDYMGDISTDAMRFKPGRMDKELMLDVSEEVVHFVNKSIDSRLPYTEEDIAKNSAWAVEDIRAKNGVYYSENSSQIVKNDDGTTTIKALYMANENAGFTNAQEAMDSAFLALKDHGIAMEDLTLMARRGTEWVELEGEALRRAMLGGKGGYAVRANVNYDVNPMNIVRQGKVVFNTLFDPVFSGGVASDFKISNYVSDVRASFSPEISLSALRGADKVNRLLKLVDDEFNDFTKIFDGLPNGEQKNLINFMKEANLSQIPYNEATYVARNFNPTQIEALRKFKRAWDTHYWLENRALAQRFKKDGWELFYAKNNDTRFIVQKTTQQTAKGKQALDPTTDIVETLTDDAIEQLYESGGYLAKTIDETQIGEDAINYIVVRNDIDSYSRLINENDTILRYRPGYYSNYVNANRIIEKVSVADPTKRIAVDAADGEFESAQLLKRLRRNELEPDKWEYVVRDARELTGDLRTTYGLNSGRINTRYRGKFTSERLGGGNLQSKYVADPIEAWHRSAASASRVTGMRQVIDAAEGRYMAEFGHLTDGKMPLLEEDIIKAGRATASSKDVREARKLFDYIQTLKGASVKSSDEYIQSALRGLAHIAGGAKLGKTESTLLWMSKALKPEAFARTFAFHAGLTFNPARQALVQRSQMLQLGFITPNVGSVLNGVGAFHVGRWNLKAGAKMLGVSPQEMKRLLKEWDDAGLTASTDKHVLLEAGLQSVADNRDFFRQTRRAVGKFTGAVRHVGFDAAENDNLLAHWFAFREQAKSKGMDLNLKSTQDWVAAQARSYSGGMNFAGKFKYQDGLLGVALQFYSIGHKMFLNQLPGLGTKSVDNTTRATAALGNMVMYGMPRIGVGWLDEYYMDTEGKPLPEDLRNRLNDGVLDWGVNGMLSALFGEPQGLAIGESFDPRNMNGFAKFFEAIATQDFGQALLESPSGHLFVDGKVGDFFKLTGKMFKAEHDPFRLSDLVYGAAHLTSGFSNGFKSIMALEYGKKFSSTGTVMDESVTSVEALAQAFGIRTKTEQRAGETYELLFDGEKYKDSREFESDVKEWWKLVKSVGFKRGIPAVELENHFDIMGAAWQAFKTTNPLRAQQVLAREIAKDYKANDLKWMELVLNQIGVKSKSEILKVIGAAPMSQSDKEFVIDQVKQYDDVIKRNL